MFDVSVLTPEARPIVSAAAKIYHKHLQPWLLGILVHGSAYKGGFIPGCSDIDLQIYLKAEVFGEHRNLPFELAVAIQRELRAIDTSPFQYLQAYELPEQPEEILATRNWVGPIPGAYRLIYGILPAQEATAEQLIAGSKNAIKRAIDYIPHDVAHEMLQHGGGQLERRTRLICTDVWPALYSLLALRTQQPFDIWRLSKEEAIALLPESEAAGQAIRNFYRSVYRYYGDEQTFDNMLAIFEHARLFASAVEKWYNQQAEE